MYALFNDQILEGLNLDTWPVVLASIVFIILIVVVVYSFISKINNCFEVLKNIQIFKSIFDIQSQKKTCERLNLQKKKSEIF